jgi:subtilisin family serine protease
MKSARLLTVVLGLGLICVPTGAIDEALGQARDGGAPARYIVRAASPSLAAYRGEIAGLAATSPTVTREVRLELGSPAARAYQRHLEREQLALRQRMERALGRDLETVYQYLNVLNAFVVAMSSREAARVARLPGVTLVERDQAHPLHTDAGPAWMGAHEIWSAPDFPTRGEGVIVGILDTGINLRHPSFAAVASDGYVHVNPFGAGRFVGWCDPAHPLHHPSFVCNDKLIGAWDFADATWQGENDGPEDNNGHGSHVAAIAAGNPVEATLVAPTATYRATISGVAPRANFISYDVCYEGCFTSDVIAALNQAVADGVHVVNESIGIGGDPWESAKHVAYLDIFAANIVAVRSTGNSGPRAGTANREPAWTISVGSVTHDRQFDNGLVGLVGPPGAPGDMFGRGFTSGYGPAPIVYAADHGDPLCLQPFPPATWRQAEIVVCDRGINPRVEKGAHVLAGGAGGLVLVDDGLGLMSDAHLLPGVHVSRSDGAALKAWLASGGGHVAQIAGATARVHPSHGDILAAFSSRGPKRGGVVKPDLVAPGVSIVAAYRSHGPGAEESYALLGGTSMASPHAAGAAALLRALHPDWSAARIRSALMSTAARTGLKEDGVTPLDAFDAGGGRIDLGAARRAGLVLDLGTTDYQAARAARNSRNLNLPAMQDDACNEGCVWTRTVTNPTGRVLSWQGSYEGEGLARLEPDRFTLGPGESVTFTLTLDLTGLEEERWHFGRVAWRETSAWAADAVLPVAAQMSTVIDELAPWSPIPEVW